MTAVRRINCWYTIIQNIRKTFLSNGRTVLIILNVRHEARDGFIDSSGREIRQVDNAMQLFFEGISQNVSYLAAQQLRECHRSLGGNGRSRRATARSGGYGLDGVS